MSKHFLLSVSFLAIIAAPSHGGPPRDNYGPGLDLLKQSAVQLALAHGTSVHPVVDDIYWDAAAWTLLDAITAAELADGAKGGDGRKNAIASASDACAAVLILYYLNTVETNPASAEYLTQAANSAIQGAILLDKSVSRNLP